MLTSIIPLPYRWLALALAALAVAGFGWVKGAGHVQDKWDAAVLKQSLITARTQQRQAEATVQVVTQYVDRVRTVREAGGEIIKEVPVYVSLQSDAACLLPAGFVRLHDAAAAGRLPDPAGSADAAGAGIALSAATAAIAENYRRCHETAEQLTALQAWSQGMSQAGAE